MGVGGVGGRRSKRQRIHRTGASASRRRLLGLPCQIALLQRAPCLVLVGLLFHRAALRNRSNRMVIARRRRRRRRRFIDKPCKRYSNSLSGDASRRIVLRNLETDTPIPERSDTVPEGGAPVMPQGRAETAPIGRGQAQAPPAENTVSMFLQTARRPGPEKRAPSSQP